MDHPPTYGFAEDRVIEVQPESYAVRPGSPEAPKRRFSLSRMIVFDLLIAACLLHGWVAWVGIGGYEGIKNDWPVLLNDHTLYFHTASITRTFLKTTGTTAGYDPMFMAGYPKSLIFPSSSTLPELVLYLFGSERPELAFKLYVFLCTALYPWLVLWTAASFGASLNGRLVAVALGLAYFWIDFPVGYASLGMVPYLTAIPIGLLATQAIAGFVEHGGFFRWAWATFLCTFCVLVHFTSAMVVIPAGALAYVVGIVVKSRSGQRFPVMRHVGIWLIPVLVLALNAFWWWPGIPLASTKGDSGFAFSHPEPLVKRLIEFFTVNPESQCWLLGGGLIGLVVLAGRNSILLAALGGFVASGFFWGYLAGAFRSLDFLQPGRHTFAFFLALNVATAIAWDEVVRRLKPGKKRITVLVSVFLVIIGFRSFAQRLDIILQRSLGWKQTLLMAATGSDWRSPHGPVDLTFLSTKPTPLMLWAIERIKQYVEPGERLLFEEAGFEVPGEIDPFQTLRFSALLPAHCGVEVIGGPYLHASLTTNFTQFGEGKLCENKQWDRKFFVDHAKLYRPAAIVCWTRKSRAFCEANPDLIEIKEIDPSGVLMIARVKGFGGATIRGEAKVKAEINRLTVTDIKPDLDGLTVLRYHSVPCLRSSPEGLIQPVKLEGDPVPFIGVKASAQPIVIEMAIPPPWVSQGTK